MMLINPVEEEEEKCLVLNAKLHCTGVLKELYFPPYNSEGFGVCWEGKRNSKNQILQCIIALNVIE